MWVSLGMIPAISKAKTPTLEDLLITEEVLVGGVTRDESKLWDMVFLTLISHVSRAIIIIEIKELRRCRELN